MWSSGGYEDFGGCGPRDLCANADDAKKGTLHRTLI